MTAILEHRWTFRTILPFEYAVLLNAMPQLLPQRPSVWPMVAFLVGYVAMLSAISDYYIVPALQAYRLADAAHKQLLSAHSALILSILLLILASGLLLTFRIGRFFFPRADVKRTRTKYVDAWAEAGKRSTPEEQD